MLLIIKGNRIEKVIETYMWIQKNILRVVSNIFYLLLVDKY